jgi:hypothetical protein
MSFFTTHHPPPSDIKWFGWHRRAHTVQHHFLSPKKPIVQSPWSPSPLLHIWRCHPTVSSATSRYRRTWLLRPPPVVPDVSAFTLTSSSASTKSSSPAPVTNGELLSVNTYSWTCQIGCRSLRLKWTLGGPLGINGLPTQRERKGVALNVCCSGRDVLESGSTNLLNRDHSWPRPKCVIYALPDRTMLLLSPSFSSKILRGLFCKLWTLFMSQGCYSS